MGDAPEVKETAQQRAFAQIAAQRMADYRQRWLPLQRTLIRDVQQMGRADSAERKEASGKAATDSAIRFGEAKGALEGALSSSTGGPASGKFKLSSAGLGDDEATSRGLGMAASDAAIDDAYTQGLASIAAMGRGESAGAVQGMGDIAQMSGRQAAMDAQMSLERRAGQRQLAGQALGLGAAYLSQPRAPGGIGATNDFGGVTPQNAVDQWTRYGTSGD